MTIQFQMKGITIALNLSFPVDVGVKVEFVCKLLL